MTTWTNWKVGKWHNGQRAIVTNEGALIATMEAGSEYKTLIDEWIEAGRYDDLVFDKRGEEAQ